MDFQTFLLLEKSPPGMEDVPEAIKKDSKIEDFFAFQIAWKRFRELVLDNRSKFKDLLQIYTVAGKEKIKVPKENWKEVAKVVKEIRKEKEQQSQ